MEHKSLTKGRTDEKMTGLYVNISLHKSRPVKPKDDDKNIYSF